MTPVALAFRLTPSRRARFFATSVVSSRLVTANAEVPTVVKTPVVSGNAFYQSDGDTPRFVEIAVIVAKVFVAPVVSSLFQQGVPSDWNDIWQRSITITTTSSASLLGANKTVLETKTIAQLLTAMIEQLGPTYVKFGQALSSRSDLIPEELANSLARLQDNMAPTFDGVTAKLILLDDLALSVPAEHEKQSNVKVLMANLSDDPVASASIGQVYRSILPEYGPVAVKIQRPGLRELVERDAVMLRGIAEWMESLWFPSWWHLTTTRQQTSQSVDDRRGRIVRARVVKAVDEFTTRVSEELDYRNEASNMIKFAGLYSHRRNESKSASDVSVVVPHVYLDYCSANIIVMEWIEGSKLTKWNTTFDSVEGDIEKVENLSLLRSASAATLSQLLVTGILHADPHGGNILKVPMNDGQSNGGTVTRLGYLDFGMISTVPESVRDALVCAVSQVVFGRNVTAVVDLLGQLQLLDPHTTQEPTQRAALVSVFNTILVDVLHFPNVNDTNSGEKRSRKASTSIPQLRFDRLLGGLTLLVTQFALQLPPYFLNNARALATLEGIIKKLDPTHNAMEAIYPFAVKRLFGNPSGSLVVERTVLDLLRNPVTGSVTVQRLWHLLDDAALVAGQNRRRVAWDILSTSGGRRIARKVGATMVWQFCNNLVRQWQLYRVNSRRTRRQALFPYLRL